MAHSNPNVAVIDTVRQLPRDAEIGIVDSVAVEEDLAADVAAEVVAWIGAGSEEEEECCEEGEEVYCRHFLEGGGGWICGDWGCGGGTFGWVIC